MARSKRLRKGVALRAKSRNYNPTVTRSRDPTQRETTADPSNRDSPLRPLAVDAQSALADGIDDSNEEEDTEEEKEEAERGELTLSMDFPGLLEDSDTSDADLQL